MTPIDFARLPASRFETCAGFVARWLQAIGWPRTPTRREIMRAWDENGALNGCAAWCELIGLQRSAPWPHCIAVAEQAGGGLLVGVIDENGYFVTRAFGTMIVAKLRIIAAWRIPAKADV